MTKSARLLYFSISFFVGIAIRDLFFIPWIVIYAVWVTSVLLFVFPYKHTYIHIMYIGLFGIVIGITRMTIALAVENDHMFITNFLDSEYSFSAEVVRESDIRDTHQKVTIDNIHIESTHIKGRALMLVGIKDDIQLSDKVSFTCTLEKPKPFDTFRYDKYLERFSIYAICAFPDHLRITQSYTLSQYIFSVKKIFIKNIQDVLPEPHASLAAGILLGERKGLSDALTETFQKVGITHILALSGFNIAVIVSSLLYVGKTVGVPRRILFWGIIAGISVFVFMTGASPSVTRAAVMGGVVLAAYEIGRYTKSIHILLIAGVGMVALNPKILLWDIGFQLSFMATLGLMIGSSIFLSMTNAVPFHSIKSTVTATLSAIIFTLPLSIYYFGGFSLVAIPVNMFVVPLIPLAMLFSFFSGVLGAVGVITYLWMVPAYALLELVLTISKVGGMVPFGYITVEKISLLTTAGMYVILFGGIYIRKKNDTKRAY